MKTAHLLLIVSGWASQLLAQHSQPGLISVPGAANVSASGHSYAPLLSTDRRYVVFLSSAKNLVTGDNLASWLDVLRHDLQTGETILISRAANTSGGANANSSGASISSNAQWIAFSSAASDLIPSSDYNSATDIFLFDANTQQHSLITRGVDGNSPANAVGTRNLSLSDKPHISADGRWIAFESFATNLTVETDVNNDSDVFLRDTLNQQTLLISVALDGAATANAKSEVVGISAEGNYVLFSSIATNLLANGPTNGNQELYLRNVGAATTTWVGHSNTIPANGTGAPVPYNCRWASVAPDGAFVLYKVEFASAIHANFARVHLYDRQADSNIVVTTRATNGVPIHMSSDGRFIAYDEVNHVFLWDRQTGTRTQVSHVTVSHSPKVSDNGSIVAFLTSAPSNTFQIYYRNTATAELRHLTENLSGVPSAQDHIKSLITVDPAGEFILFDSPEDNLVADDGNHASDIFLHSVASGDTRLISRAHAARPALTAVAESSITNFCLSADGNRLLFFSSDSNLVPGDTNGWQDAFLRDLGTGQTFALSTNADGLLSASNSVTHGLLSANGRFALLGIISPPSRYEFSYFVPASIIRKDLDTGETFPILTDVRPPVPTFPLSIPWFGFSISADGSRVSYPSNGLIIVVDPQNGTQTNITSSGSWTEPILSPNGRYVMHVNTSSRELAMTDLSTALRTIINSSYARGAAFSQNGQVIVYGTASSSVYVFSVSGRSNTLVCNSCSYPSASADGRVVAYETAGGGTRQIEVKDLATGKTTPVTRNIFGLGAANSDTTFPVISADGRFVAYTSKATNLTTDVPNGWKNLYVFDRLQGTTVRITGTHGNTGYGSGSASQHALGADGRTLVFQSFASDFVANDFNDTRDVFLLKLGEGDADNDGMSDSWEQTHFSTTERDGTADFDQDGSTDLAEYLAGTNPADGQSVLEVLQITSVGTGERHLLWRAEPGKAYRVEFISNVTSRSWTPLPQVITAVGPTASARDTTATAERRFYRVALVQ